MEIRFVLNFLGVGRNLGRALVFDGSFNLNIRVQKIKG